MGDTMKGKVAVRLQQNYLHQKISTVWFYLISTKQVSKTRLKIARNQDRKFWLLSETSQRAASSKTLHHRQGLNSVNVTHF